MTKQVADLHTSTIDPAAALPAALPGGSAWSDPDGGMFTWVRLPGDTFRSSFTSNTPEVITEGIARLGRALRG